MLSYLAKMNESTDMKGCWIKTLPPNGNLQLTMRPSTVRSGDGVFASWYLNPIHSDNL